MAAEGRQGACMCNSKGFLNIISIIVFRSLHQELGNQFQKLSKKQKNGPATTEEFGKQEYWNNLNIEEVTAKLK